MDAKAHPHETHVAKSHELRVRDLMSRQVLTIAPEDEPERARTLMRERCVRHLPVLDAAGSLCGIVTDRDLLRHLPVEAGGGEPRARSIAQVMSAPVLTIGPDEAVASAAHLMLEGKLGCLPVVERGTLVGILTEADFVRFLGPRRSS